MMVPAWFPVTGGRAGCMSRQGSVFGIDMMEARDMVSEQRVRKYRRMRRQYGYTARDAFYAMSDPKYPNAPRVSDFSDSWSPEAVRMVVDGRVFLVRILWDSEYDPTENDEFFVATTENLENFMAYGVEVRDTLGRVESVWGIQTDEREPEIGERHVRDMVCEMVDCLLWSMPKVARLMLPAGVA